MLFAGVACLGAVAMVLIKAANSHGSEKAFLIAIGVGSVAASWGVLHTIFTLRYARIFYTGSAGGIQFQREGAARLHRLRLPGPDDRFDVPGLGHGPDLEADETDRAPPRLALVPVRGRHRGSDHQRGRQSLEQQIGHKSNLSNERVDRQANSSWSSLRLPVVANVHVGGYGSLVIPLGTPKYAGTGHVGECGKESPMNGTLATPTHFLRQLHGERRLGATLKDFESHACMDRNRANDCIELGKIGVFVQGALPPGWSLARRQVAPHQMPPSPRSMASITSPELLASRLKATKATEKGTAAMLYPFEVDRPDPVPGTGLSSEYARRTHQRVHELCQPPPSQH